MQASDAGAGAAAAVEEAKVKFSEKLIDGKAIASTVRAEVKQSALEIASRYGVQPGLAVVIVGSRPDSETYVRNKIKACGDCAIQSFKHALPEHASAEEVMDVIRGLNADAAVHGILVQLPLPPHMDETTVLDAISADKDVDGFHPLVMGRLALRYFLSVALSVFLPSCP